MMIIISSTSFLHLPYDLLDSPTIANRETLSIMNKWFLIHSWELFLQLVQEILFSFTIFLHNNSKNHHTDQYK